jgi:hypothetical protein
MTFAVLLQPSATSATSLSPRPTTATHPCLMSPMSSDVLWSSLLLLTPPRLVLLMLTCV